MIMMIVIKLTILGLLAHQHSLLLTTNGSTKMNPRMASCCDCHCDDDGDETPICCIPLTDGLA